MFLVSFTGPSTGRHMGRQSDIQNENAFIFCPPDLSRVPTCLGLFPETYPAPNNRPRPAPARGQRQGACSPTSTAQYPSLLSLESAGGLQQSSAVQARWEDRGLSKARSFVEVESSWVPRGADTRVSPHADQARQWLPPTPTPR